MKVMRQRSVVFLDDDARSLFDSLGTNTAHSDKLEDNLNQIRIENAVKTRNSNGKKDNSMGRLKQSYRND